MPNIGNKNMVKLDMYITIRDRELLGKESDVLGITISELIRRLIASHYDEVFKTIVREVVVVKPLENKATPPEQPKAEQVSAPLDGKPIKENTDGRQETGEKTRQEA